MHRRATDDALDTTASACSSTSERAGRFGDGGDWLEQRQDQRLTRDRFDIVTRLEERWC